MRRETRRKMPILSLRRTARRKTIRKTIRKTRAKTRRKTQILAFQGVGEKLFC